MRKVFMCLFVILMLALQVQIAFGACCLPTGGCSDVSELTCNEFPGAVFVPGSCTEPGICQLDGRIGIPTMNQWGMIIFMLFAGIGAVYFMRRQRRARD